MPRKSKVGRRRGGRNKGYFYRTSHKVWCAQQDKRFVPFVDENGDRLRDENALEAVVKQAHARYLLTVQKPTAAHVNDLGDRMEFHLKAGETKTRRARIVRLTDPKIMELVRRGLRDHKSGAIFRNAHDKPHAVKSLSRAFLRAKDRATAKGMKFDDDCCLYSCRHTYAERSKGSGLIDLGIGIC